MQTTNITLGIYGISPVWEKWFLAEFNKAEEFKILFIHHNEKELLEDIAANTPTFFS